MCRMLCVCPKGPLTSLKLHQGRVLVKHGGVNGKKRSQREMGGQSQCLRRRGGWGIFLTHPSKGRLRPSSALGCGSLQRGFLLPVSHVAEPPGTRFLLGHSGSRLCLAISLWDLGELAPLRRPQCSCLLNRGSDALSPSYVRSTLAEGGSIRSGPGHCGDVKLNMVSAPFPAPGRHGGGSPAPPLGSAPSPSLGFRGPHRGAHLWGGCSLQSPWALPTVL